MQVPAFQKKGKGKKEKKRGEKKKKREGGRRRRKKKKEEGRKKEEEERKKGREEKKKKTDYLSAPPKGWPAGPLGPVPLAQCCCTTFLEGPFGRIQKKLGSSIVQRPKRRAA